MHIDLDGDVERGLFIPPGVAHGFASHTDLLLSYLVDNYHNPADELGVEGAGDPGAGVGGREVVAAEEAGRAAGGGGAGGGVRVRCT